MDSASDQEVVSREEADPGSVVLKSYPQLPGWTCSVHAVRSTYMAFELFTSSRTSEPFISLGKEGFRLSTGFLRTHHLEKATAVRLYFDRAKRTIGFQFPTGAHPQEGSLRPKLHAGGFVVRAQGFFSSQGINPAQYAGRYRPQEMKDRVLKRLFVIQLRTSTSGQHPASQGHRG